MPAYLDDSEMRSLRTSVRSCEPEPGGLYAVVLEDTIVFPGGGGHPCDLGTVAGCRIVSARPGEGGSVLHILEEPVSGGVEVVLDWERRRHFMQHHTAQHLLTAMADKLFGWATTAMHLGLERSDVELAVPHLGEDSLIPLEDAVNRKILERLPVRAGTVGRGDLEAMGVRSRRLPGEVVELRTIAIEGIDLNTCGGLHVRDTGEVQVFSIEGTGQIRGGTRVFFACGALALSRMEERRARERRLSAILTCGPAEHVASVERLLERTREAGRLRSSLEEELAGFLARDLAEQGSPAFFSRPGADAGFLRSVAAAWTELRPEGMLLLTSGPGAGIFMLAGPEAGTQAAGHALATALGGKGGGTGRLFRGSAPELPGMVEALRLLGEARAGTGSR